MPVVTPGPQPSGDVNWAAVLDHHASRAPDRPAVVFEGETVTYGEMGARAAALAGGLRERGVRRGDVVGILALNCPEILETVFAANRLGAVAMPVNWRLAPQEVRYVLEHSGARALVCDGAMLDLAGRATGGMEGALVRACVPPAAPAGWTPLA
ncbi:MAG: AMP-binding protein, partial [Acidimicrobiales bacterium]